MKFFFLFVFILIPIVSLADTVRITDPKNLSISGVTSASFSLSVDAPATDATTEAAPARVYVPLTNAFTDSFGRSHDEYFSQYSSTGVSVLFDTSKETHVVSFPLTTVVTGTKYLYAAAKSSTGSIYKVVQEYSSPLTSNQDVIFEVSPKLICDQFASECTTLTPSINTNTSKETFKLYFFLSTASSLALGDTLDPVINTGGVYFEFLMSNRIYESSDLKVFITNSRKGDARVILDYGADSSMLDFEKIIIFKHSTSTSSATNGPIGAYTGSLINQDFSTSESGEATVNQLQNGVDTTLSVAFLDKFGFASTLSDDVTIRPIEIQELLKKEACYLLTAGFGEEHYIITFFRHYRDQVLANAWPGKQFIKLYYSSAPQYAVIIYRSQFARLVIRGIAYTLYFFFNYYWLVLIFIGSCLFLDLRKNKILLQE